MLGVRVRWAVAAPDAIVASIEVAAQMTLLQAEASEAEPEATEQVETDEALEAAPPPGEPVGRDVSPGVADGERRPLLGSLLLRDGLVTEDELDAALAQQRLSSTRRLGEILVARGALSEAQVSRALAEQHGLPFVELEKHDIDPAARALLPVELAHRHLALPVSYLADGSVLVVVADPTSAIHDEELRAELGVSVQYAVAAPTEIETAIASTSEAERVAAPPIEVVDAGSSSVDDGDDERPGADVERPTFTLVPAQTNQDEAQEETDAATAHDTVEHALSLGASAIHFAPRSTGMVVHVRIDGDLRELAILPLSDLVTNELGRLVGVDLIRSAGRATRGPSRSEKAKSCWKLPFFQRSVARESRFESSTKQRCARAPPCRTSSRKRPSARRSRMRSPSARGCSSSAERPGADRVRRFTQRSSSSTRRSGTCWRSPVRSGARSRASTTSRSTWQRASPLQTVFT
ncbi:hypothetical protein BH20ACT13_BH20ACT13_06880 [soil metagenome]